MISAPSFGQSDSSLEKLVGLKSILSQVYAMETFKQETVLEVFLNATGAENDETVTAELMEFTCQNDQNQTANTSCNININLNIQVNSSEVLILYSYFAVVLHNGNVRSVQLHHGDH